MIKINNKITFSYNKPPIIIAEISGNHGGNKQKFLKLIKYACLSGADLIKIQTYEPKDITLNIKNSNFKIKKGLWKNKYLWDLYKKACTPFSWHKEAFNITKKYNKILFSSPFSIRAVDFLEKFDVPIYKIASFEITDHQLIKHIASKKKPIIISTGMSSLGEIDKAIKIIERYHKKIIILHCVSNYPTQIKDTNLNRINILKKRFKKYMIGVSDHTNDIFSSIASVSLGVVAIEKHFNINKNKSPDAKFSIDKIKLKNLKEVSTDTFLSVKKTLNPKIAKRNIELRRSIFAKKEIKKNEKISLENVISLRPAIGIRSNYIFNIIGKRARNKISRFSPIFYKNLLK